MTTTRDQGLDVFRQLLPGLVPDQPGSTLDDGGFAGELGEHALEHVFGALWTRDGLDRRSRSLVTLGILIALRATDELHIHFQIALRNGVTEDELAEVVYHSAAYAGHPAASAARRVGREALTPHITSARQ
jgi:4-carboxymuconolactone decarboxylase